MSGIGRLRARIGSSTDEGSAVVVLPILGLLVCAGAAALAGIALQPDEPTTPPPTINASQLGEPCTDEVGPLAPRGPQGYEQQWLDAMAACIEGRVVSAYGTRVVAVTAGYDGVAAGTTFDGVPAVVIRWTGTEPTAVSGWVARFPNSLVSVTSTSSSSSS